MRGRPTAEREFPSEEVNRLIEAQLAKLKATFEVTVPMAVGKEDGDDPRYGGPSLEVS